MTKKILILIFIFLVGLVIIGCPTTGAPSTGQTDTDTDDDGIPDIEDKCAGEDDNLDADSDGVPDGCDKCAGKDDNLDDDFDGVPNGCDMCPDFPDDTDTDGDGWPDACDSCPYDYNPMGENVCIPPTILDVCDGVSHGSGESYITICIKYYELPYEGNTTKFSLTLDGSDPAIIHVTHNDEQVDCAQYTIYRYGTFNWTAEVRGRGGASIVSGTIIVDSNNQDCSYTGSTDTDN